MCSFILITLGGAITYGYAKNSSKTSFRKATSTDSKLQLNATNRPSVSQGQSDNNLSVGNNQTGSSLQSNLGQSAPSNSHASLPGPENFKQYDQYANSKDILIGEISVGSGKQPTPDKKVAVIYKGWLTNGQLFDQSKANDKGQPEPIVFQLGQGQVIAGWEQGIAGMKVGGMRRLIIPPALGYGASGQGPIGPNAVLVFDVQLVDAE